MKRGTAAAAAVVAALFVEIKVDVADPNVDVQKYVATRSMMTKTNKDVIEFPLLSSLRVPPACVWWTAIAATPFRIVDLLLTCTGKRETIRFRRENIVLN
jgi:hypothetical protein